MIPATGSLHRTGRSEQRHSRKVIPINGDRGEPYIPQSDIMIGIGVAGACAIGMVYVLGNDIGGKYDSRNIIKNSKKV